MVAEKYCDMRMRFQSGLSDAGSADAQKKPRLAVTTRTLEALIRLSTAHAKLKLRKDHVLPEDVNEAWKLMMAAREEDVPDAPAGNAPGGDDGASGPSAGTKKRKRTTRARESSASPASSQEGISGARINALMTLVARAFGRAGTQQILKGDLLEGVNSGLAAGEVAFDEDEFESGLRVMEGRNKILVSQETGDVMIVG